MTLQLKQLTTTQIFEWATPRGVAWTCDLVLNDQEFIKVYNAGNGGATQFTPKTMTNKEWQLIYERLENEAKELIGLKYEALDTLICFSEDNDNLTDPKLVERTKQCLQAQGLRKPIL
jgi:hypothetical protein